MRETPLFQIRAIPLLLAAAVVLLLSTLLERPFYGLENYVEDRVWQLLSQQKDPERRVVIIDIDEASVAQYGPWPWPRDRIELLATTAAEQGVALRIFNIVFAEPKPTDISLAGALQQNPTVMAQILALNSVQSLQMGQLQGGVENGDCKEYYQQSATTIGNSPLLEGVAAGHITPQPSTDGVVRKMPAMICSGQKSYPALAIATIAAGAGLELDSFVRTPGRQWLGPQHQLTHPDFPGLTIPLDNSGNVVIPWWLSRDSIISISARDLIEGNVPKELLQGAWALIGTTALGAGDPVSTPQGGVVGNAEIHLQLISSILDGTIPYQPHSSTLLQLLWVAVIILIFWWSNRLRGGWRVYGLPLAGLLLFGFTIVIHGLLLYRLHLIIPWGAPAIFALLSGVFIALREHLLIREESARLYQNLSSYLPAHAARKIAQHEPRGVVDAHHEQVLVLYADIRNFSAWCDQLPAEQVGALLHTFFIEAAEIIHQAGGATEEYVGDAIMAVWRGEYSPHAPLRAAHQLVAAGEQLFGEETGSDRLPPLAIGVGIEQGEVLTGSFGPVERRVHTIIGRTVTAAMRLQEMTAELAEPVVVGQNAAAAWKEIVMLESLDKFLLPGIEQPQEIFVPTEKNK